MKVLKVLLAAAICGALIFLTYIYVGSKSDSGSQGAGGPQGAGAPPAAKGGKAPSKGGRDKKADKPGAAPQNVTSIRSQIAEYTTLYDYVFTTGEIAPQSSVDVFPEIGGKVKSVYVSLGSEVKKGDLLVKVDPSSPGLQYALNPVYAPISGTVTKAPVKQGTTVSLSTVLATIGDVENLQLTVSVPERYVSALRPGLKAEVILEAYQDAVFGASVIRVSPVVDGTSRTKEVTLAFDSYDSRINAGMFAKVKLYTEVYDCAVVIPSDAVIEKSGKKFVFVVNSDSTVTEREVTLGKSVDNVVQILSGVSEGEKMVVEGMRVLGNGSAVKDISSSGQGAQ